MRSWQAGVARIKPQPILELCGERRLLIENHNGVAAYGKACIAVNVGFGQIVVSGENLKLCHIQSTQLVISGRIDQVTLHRGNM